MTTPGPAAKRAVLVWAIVVAFVVVLLGVGAVFLGGSKTRQLFDGSADALAGETAPDAGSVFAR